MSKRTRTVALIFLLLAVAVALFVAFWVQLSSLETRGDRQDAAIAALQDERDTAVAEKDATADALGEANGALTANGLAPVPTPTATASSTPGPRGEPGPAPTDAQVRDAVTLVLQRNPSLTTGQVAVQVASYLRANPPPAGTAGRDGTDGANATEAQVAAAVARYLTANPPPAGVNGVNGADAPPVTQEQLAAQVQAYLAANPPASGPPGSNGIDGVGVTGFTRTDDCHLIVALTDGTTTDLGNVCGNPGTTGRGITSVNVAACRLLVSYSDGVTEDAGNVCSEPARPDPTTTDPPVEPTDTPSSEESN